MKIYAIPAKDAATMRDLEMQIKGLAGRLKDLKDKHFKAAVTELPLDFHEERIGKTGYKSPDMDITEDFNYIYTRNAK